MKIFFVLLLIIFLAFSGYHLSFRGLKLPLFARKFYLTGTEFLFLGLLLGPCFLNILDLKTCAGLEPLCALLLGWIGLLFGFQFELFKLRRFPLDFFKAAVLEGVTTFVLVFCGVYFTLPLFINLNGAIKIVTSLTLAAAAACTAQTGLALFAQDFISRRQDTIKLLRYISSIDGISAMLIFGVAFFFRPFLFHTSTWLGAPGWGTVFSMMVCIGLLILYMLFLSQRRDESELTLVVIGMVVLTSGAALMLNFSPLITNFFVGFCLVNLTRDKERIFDILISVEKPVYLLLLVFLGAGWAFDSYWLILAAVYYFTYRLAGKLISGAFIRHISQRMNRHPSYLGCGLIEQSGLPLVILFDFQQSFPIEIAEFVTSLALMTIIFNDILSPVLLKRLLAEEEL